MTEKIEVKVETYGYQKVKKSDVMVNIPKEAIFFQEYNRRVVIGVFPQFATWIEGNPLKSIHVIEITNESIQTSAFNVDSDSLSDIISHFEMKGKTREDRLNCEVVHYLTNHFTTDRVDRNVFIAKYQEFCKNIAEIAAFK